MNFKLPKIFRIIQNSTLKIQNLEVKELRFSLTDFSQPQFVDKINDLLKRGLHDGTAAADGAETQDRALPQILVAAFCNGDIELVGDPCLDAPQYSSFSFEGVVLGEKQAELENTDNDGGILGGRFSSYRLSPAEARDASRPPEVGVMRRMTTTRS